MLKLLSVRFVVRYCLPALVALISVLGSSGCAPNRSLGTVLRAPDGTRRLETRLIINNSKIARRIAVDGIDAQMLNGFLQPKVQLRNTSSKPLAFVYRFAWTDANGYAVESPGQGWEEAWIEGYQSKGLVGVAPSGRANNFKLEIQRKQ